MSIEESEIAVRQSKVYACAYAITAPTTINGELTYVMDDDGHVTQLPYCARRFDSLCHAVAFALALGIPYTNVVRVHLSCYAERAFMVEDSQIEEQIPIPQTPIRVA